MDTVATDQESEHKENLLESIKDVMVKCKIIEKERQEIEFSLLRSTPPLKMRKLDEFLNINVRDPMLYLDEEQEPQTDKYTAMNAAFDILNIQVGSMSVTQLEDKMQEYSVDCSLHDELCKFSLRFACESLDSPNVQLVDAKIQDPKQADDAQQFVEVCIKKNSIPLLLQGLLEYCNKVCQRAEFLQQIISQFPKCISVGESDDDGTLSIQVKSAAKDKTKLELQWGICYDADLTSFSFAFGIKCQSSLRKEHPNVIKGIVESKNMAKQLSKNFKTLMSLVING